MTSEDELYALLGAVAVRWNAIEASGRRILRGVSTQSDMPARCHGARSTTWIEVELRASAAPLWAGSPGEPFLRCLVEAIERARHYRDYFVEAVCGIVAPDGMEPMILLTPAKRLFGDAELPTLSTARDLQRVADHLNDLKALAFCIATTFNRTGQYALDTAGVAVAPPPKLIAPLPPFMFSFLDRD